MTDRPVRDWIRDHVLRACGYAAPQGLDWAESRAQSRTCEQFAHLRRARLILGVWRYEQTGEDKTYRAIESAIARLTRYLSDPNREYLVDAANLVELEWCSPRVQGAYWRSTHRGDPDDPGGVGR